MSSCRVGALLFAGDVRNTCCIQNTVDIGNLYNANTRRVEKIAAKVLLLRIRMLILILNVIRCAASYGNVSVSYQSVSLLSTSESWLLSIQLR